MHPNKLKRDLSRLLMDNPSVVGIGRVSPMSPMRIEIYLEKEPEKEEILEAQSTLRQLDWEARPIFIN